jgi:hypothetical protein
MLGFTGTTDTFLRQIPARILFLLENPEGAREILADWEHGRGPTHFPLHRFAAWWAMIGKKEKALPFLEKGFREGERLLWSECQSPAFDLVREDPRFVAILRATKLPTTLSKPLWPDGRHPPK